MSIPPVALAIDSEGVAEREARWSRWGSLVSRIEAQLEDDGGDDKEGRNEIAPGIVSLGGSSASSLSTSKISAANSSLGFGAGEETGGSPGLLSQSTAAVKPSRFKSIDNSQLSFALSDWIARHLTRHDGAKPMDAERRKFLEKSVRVLHSLVEKVVSRSSDNFPDGDGEEALLHPNFISSKNIAVRQYMLWETEEVTADFVRWDNSDPMTHNGKMDETRKKFMIMEAFGRVAYELFMMGQGPSVLKFCSKSRAAIGNISSALSLHDSESENNNIDEDEIVDMLRKTSRTATSEGKDSSGIISAMIDAGVPYPLRRFVSDLIDDGDTMLGRSENSFSSLTDVLADLEQMLNDPDTFLHASSPDRWKLTFGEKLYGREESSNVLMDASDRIAYTHSNDPIFQYLSGIKGRSTEVIMVSGNSGSGKSRLVRIAATSLEKRGWHFLSAKFDRLARAEPLSVLAGAFEDYLGSTLHASSDCPWAGSREMQRRLEGILGPEGLSVLSKHIPSLHLFAKVPLRSEATTQVNETMMQTLFGKLLQALSSKRTPLLLFLDDLQWADPLSLTMLSSLVKGNRPDLLHLSPENDVQDEIARDEPHEKTKEEPEETINVMFVGSYRDNEVNDDHLLTKVLQTLQSDSSVKLSNICLAGLGLEALNKMLSESLCMPVRRVRPLSELVMTKTDGQPLHVIEFIQALIADNLLDHSFIRGWEWDADSIDIFPITDSVAELFAFKLRRLKEDICLGLQIVSCFGSQVDKQVLSFVADYDGESSVDLTAAVDISAKEGLIEQTKHLVRFAHDMIQKAAMDSISEGALIPLLQKLVAALIQNASAVGELDSVLFVAVDLINRIGSNATHSPKQRALFADLNLQAASKAITVPDFTSAANYAESGIAFLGDNHWKSQYSLSLSLYETSVESLFASLTSNQDLLMERINSVCEHARSFSDEFKTHCVWVKLLSMTNLPRAIEESLNALELLGEPLDSVVSIDYKTMLGKLIKMKDQFSRERKKLFLSDKLKDCNKMRAMKVMSSLITYYHKQQSYLGALVACQMIKITAEYGHCEDSVFGVAAFASAVTISVDIDEGSAWGRTALSLMETYDKNILIPPIHMMVYGAVSVWKEPIQSTLEPLAQAIRLSFVTGDVPMAMGNTIFYLTRSFNSGCKCIPILLCEVKALARQHVNHFSNDSTQHMCSPFLQFHLAPLYKTLIDLEGNLVPQAENDVSFPLDTKLANNDDILQVALGMKECTVLHGILTHQTAKAFIFRDMAGALKYTDLFYEHFLTKGLSKQYTSIWNVFYEGLINFHFLRQTGNSCHQSRGESAILTMKEWARHSDWNFKNKLLLMEAESHYSRKEFNRATLCYEASIKAAQDHRFLRDEAIANELAGIFFYERGFQPKAYELFVRSIECYKRWGAAVVARKLENSIKKQFDTNVMQHCMFDDSIAPAASSIQSSSKKRQFLA